MMKIAAHISVIYTDEHLVGLRVRSANGVFAGQADVYADSDVLAAFAGVLRGFPTSQSDTREFEIGSFDAAHASGGVVFRFFCVDSVGHAVVEVSLRADSKVDGGVSDTVKLLIRVEAAAVDSFVVQLERMAMVVGETAILKSAV